MVVNAHSDPDVSRLMELADDKLRKMLDTQKEYSFCKEVRDALDDWSRRNSAMPIMSLVEFGNLCKDEILVNMAPGRRPCRDAKLYDGDGQKVVLSYLNDTGDIIYPKKLDFIVVNPRWFGIGVLGYLIDSVGGAGKSFCRATGSTWNGIFRQPPKSIWKVDHNHGFVNRRNIESLLERSLRIMDEQHIIPVEKLIQLLTSLGMGFEEHPGNPDSRLFIPALFDDDTETAAKGTRKLKWTLHHGAVYIGRRLECQDKITTFLTPGFFPRLQVHLVNYIRAQEWMENSGIKVDRNLIQFTQNGKEIIVEYSGDIDYFIDIMVRSSKLHAVALKFVEEHLIRNVVQFCASPQGCQGVLLEQSVIRPLCVEGLHLCVDRKDRSVLVSTLRAKIATEGDDYEHNWRRIGTENCSDYALDLLEGEGSFKVKSSGSTVPGSNGRGKNISSSEELFSKLFYLTIEDVGFLRKIATAWNISKMMPIKLHLRCNHGDNLHEVEGQRGRNIKLKWQGGGFDVPILKYAISLLWKQIGYGISIDEWINKFFDVSEIPTIDAKTLEELRNTGETSTPASEEEILDTLEEYIDCTGSLKPILKDSNDAQFWEDFQLRRVVYKEPSGKIGWLCNEHFDSAYKQKMLKFNRNLS